MEVKTDTVRVVLAVLMHTLILGSIVYAYTVGVQQVKTPTEQYLLIGGLTVFLVLYVILTVLFDRISRQLEEIAESVDSISNSLEKINN